MSTSSEKITGINEMSGLKTIIVNGDLESLRQTLGNKTLNELEVGYLIDLAKLNNEPEMVKLLKQHAG
ncbi:hypothetical protein [Lacimicrobium sp. SS2-24]|uniref:hypothetical protein n=1 Tax=Lacimicrobium sp. SS2-24 TaxID=2005569 RepID=UPI000B4B876F|nr:hypothetical protein [Lacimicrobium sp. SS2-24]